MNAAPLLGDTGRELACREGAVNGSVHTRPVLSLGAGTAEAATGAKA